MLSLKVILHPLGKGSHYFGVGLLYKFPLNYKYTRGGWAGNPSPHLAFFYHTLAGEIPDKRLEGAKGLTTFWKGGAERGSLQYGQCEPGSRKPECAQGSESIGRVTRRRGDQGGAEHVLEEAGSAEDASTDTPPRPHPHRLTRMTDGRPNRF